MNRSPAPACPLCMSRRAAPLARPGALRYFLCPVCALAFMDPAQHPRPEQERAHYQTHENDPADARYRAFLSRLSEPLIPRLPAHARGLDLGSGPGPTLSIMLAERGLDMRIYDPFFAPDADALQQTYDFITCTETVEHLHHPRSTFEQMLGLLKPHGILAIMTQLLSSPDAFAHWWYPRDPTHVCFYQQPTLEWIARHWHLTLDRPAPNVALFTRPQR